jgi:hypothetical protein
LKPTHDRLFAVNSTERFSEAAMEVFRYQASENRVYRRYLETLGTDTTKVNKPENIPFLPINFFKDFDVVCGTEKPETVFTSSGTTGMTVSRHLVTEVDLYRRSSLDGFRKFYGDPGEYCILALLPSYLERTGSSLVYMAEDLIKTSGHPDSGFYLHNYNELALKLKELEKINQKTVLLGVTYALLDLAEQFPGIAHNRWDELVIMETGGMKGKRKEMVREELHEVLMKGFGVPSIHSEYGMTELLSQAYSKGNGIFNCPPWMQIMIRDTNDPFSYLQNGRTGGINVIDLANINSCAFIATQDLGKKYDDNSFEVLGRFDNSDIRGCNLLVQ